MINTENPYLLTDVFKELCETITVELQLENLNYQFGDLDELKETLKQMSETSEYEVKKFPLVWLVQPFTIDHNVSINAGYGDVLLRVFIITESSDGYKAKDRIEVKFKPILHPIYYKLLSVMNQHEAISYESTRRPHKQTDRYKIEEIGDIVDCVDIQDLYARINNNTKCQPYQKVA